MWLWKLVPGPGLASYGCGGNLTEPPDERRLAPQSRTQIGRLSSAPNIHAETKADINGEQGDWILFTHEGGVDVGDVDAKAEKILIPVDLSEYPSNAEIASALLKKVPKGLHN